MILCLWVSMEGQDPHLSRHQLCSRSHRDRRRPSTRRTFSRSRISSLTSSQTTSHSQNYYICITDPLSLVTHTLIYKHTYVTHISSNNSTFTKRHTFITKPLSLVAQILIHTHTYVTLQQQAENENAHANDRKFFVNFQWVHTFTHTRFTYRSSCPRTTSPQRF